MLGASSCSPAAKLNARGMLRARAVPVISFRPVEGGDTSCGACVPSCCSNPAPLHPRGPTRPGAEE
eukprot:6822872-Alexandrium_andersonii.AAC.1